jgi:hypothetical protein
MTAGLCSRLASLPVSLGVRHARGPARRAGPGVAYDLSLRGACAAAAEYLLVTNPMLGLRAGRPPSIDRTSSVT